MLSGDVKNMDTGKYSVLIVDDQGQSISLLASILSSGYNLLVVKSGRDAIDTAVKFIPDIILLDVILPDMDGYAVISELKSSETTQDIPVIFITGLGSVEEEEKGLILGAADYIRKPFSPAILKVRLLNQIKTLEQLRTIKRLSMTDQLTGLPNRLSFEENLRLEWRRAEREQTPVSILVIDLYHFKDYNEKHGHRQGDIALRYLAKAFDSTLKRSGDFAARWGGEEFVILLPNTDSVGALDVAEKLRCCAAELEVPDFNGKPTRVSVSIGINTKEKGQNITMDDFISEADSSLIEAQNKGRNMIYYRINNRASL